MNYPGKYFEKELYEKVNKCLFLLCKMVQFKGELDEK